MIVSIVNPKIELSIAGGDARFALTRFIPDPDFETVTRFLKASHVRGHKVAFIRKNWGLTHPEYPFCVSSNVIMIDDASTIEEFFRISDDLGYGLHRLHTDFQNAVVPFTFPPMLENDDFELASNLVRHGALFRDVAEAQTYFEKRLSVRDQSIDWSDLVTRDGAVKESFSMIMEFRLQRTTQLGNRRREKTSCCVKEKSCATTILFWLEHENLRARRFRFYRKRRRRKSSFKERQRFVKNRTVLPKGGIPTRPAYPTM